MLVSCFICLFFNGTLPLNVDNIVLLQFFFFLSVLLQLILQEVKNSNSFSTRTMKNEGSGYSHLLSYNEDYYVSKKIYIYTYDLISCADLIDCQI